MFQVHIFGLLLLALNGALAVIVNSKCEPTCEGVTESGTQVMDPSNCAGYYVCAEVNGVFVLSDRQECSAGDYFNINLVPPQCDSISGASSGFCDGYCNPCEVQCNEPGFLRPDPLNCSNYYLCLSADTSQIFACDTATPWFDYTGEVCQEDKSLCYSFCEEDTPYCVEPGFVLPTEQDCAQTYYYCDPPVATPFSCQDDECFNLEYGICEPSIPSPVY